MEITAIHPFLDYYERIRERTPRVAKAIPPDQIEWTFQEGRFTLGDLLRHLAAIERYQFGETVAGRVSRYPGCGRELADGYQNVLAYVDRMHRESVDIFARLTADLKGKCLTPDGTPITTWKWLRAMVEHEVHHRGQIYEYLALLGVKTPPLYGLTSEQVLELARGQNGG